MMKRMIIVTLLGAFILQLSSQVPVFTRQDSLRGSITAERQWWDLVYYHLDIRVDPDDSTIFGTNTVHYKVLEPYSIMQIDLQPPLHLTGAEQDGQTLQFEREGNVYFIELNKKQTSGSLQFVVLSYGGHPKIAKRPPWDGGITWSRDSNGLPFVASSCQGLGASVWWPCKDHMYDEPDSMLISVRIPGNLMNVSNGRLRSVEEHADGTRTTHWFVSNPINNYGVNINIGDYVHFGEKVHGEKGLLDCDYYVLRENLPKAREQFKQVPMMLEAFEYWFGPYPFYEDSYKLVEVPYLGMEHQSSVTYGNKYMNGYLGNDGSSTGWGLKFDFIIIHESGHEWFANSITYRDMADMWIHESFANYSESLYLEYHYGKEAGYEYVRGNRRIIRNDRPIQGFYGVNHQGSGDMYNKGGNMLHTLRQVVNNDAKWKKMLRGLNAEFYHQVVTGQQVESYLSEMAGMNLKPFFDQYIRDVRIPVLEYDLKDGRLAYRWSNCVRGFNMPVKVYDGAEEIWLKPTGSWNRLKWSAEEPVVDSNFYVATFNITGN